MKVIRSVEQMLSLTPSLSRAFVPTMGALHPGHLQLVREAQQTCQETVVSIFVNPTQFNDPADLQNYPRTLEEDIAKLDSVGVDMVFCPDQEDLYPDAYRYQVQETSFSKRLCGAHRPGHFNGVLTVVLKLLQIVKPTDAFFGEKDYQQYLLLRDMAKAFFLPVTIHGVACVREKSGLAMSSRNQLLTTKEREQAASLYEFLSDKTKTLDWIRDQLTEQGFRVDYLVEEQGRRFVAAYLGNVRLIDNVEL